MYPTIEFPDALQAALPSAMTRRRRARRITFFGMSEDTQATNPPGSDGDDYADTNDRDIQAKQNEGTDTAALAADPEVDAGDVNVLPGTGGPDDVGDIEVDPEELNLDGHA